ncbi:MAG: hypothetical protein KDC98_15790 [Planctomycetes bacterium]|nr:hypothetical protein [Planctomycetota bacterium]
MREVLAMPQREANRILIECLSTQDGPSGGLMQHCEAYVELILTLSPDLSEWFRWVFELGPGASEDTVAYAMHLLAEAAARGHKASDAILRDYLLHGHHWETALSEILGGEIELDAHTWLQLAPRLDDDALSAHMGTGGALWDEVARRDDRVARLLRNKLQRQADYAAQTSWSVANYAAAELSQRRWRVLQDLIDRDPAAAVPLLVDGLWDGSWVYRNKCIELCDLEQPGVRDRIIQLAAMTASHSAAVARKRLQASSPMDQ